MIKYRKRERGKRAGETAATGFSGHQWCAQAKEQKRQKTQQTNLAGEGGWEAKKKALMLVRRTRGAARGRGNINAHVQYFIGSRGLFLDHVA